jgi:hypothetical protein
VTSNRHYLWCATSITTRTDQTGETSGTAHGRRCGTRLACQASGSRPAAHTVLTDLLEAGEVDTFTGRDGQRSRKMLERYSQQRLKAKVGCSRDESEAKNHK